MSQASKLVSLVIPVYNEESAIPHFLAAVRPVLEAEPDYRFEFIFVNDGSRDGSLELLLAAREEDPRIRIVDFSRNFGKELALAAGLLPFCASGRKDMTLLWGFASAAMRTPRSSAAAPRGSTPFSTICAGGGWFPTRATTGS